MSRKFIIHAQFGLTNRLRALASAYVFAQKSQRELILVWEPDLHCDCVFGDLFHLPDFEVKDTLDTPLEGFAIYNCMETEGNDPLPFVENQSSKDIYVKTYNPVQSSLSDRKAEDHFLKALKPADEVSILINQISGISSKIGIHLRQQGRKDGVAWESPGGQWTDESQRELDFARAMGHEAYFISEIEEILKDQPDAKFFVAADKVHVAKGLEERFPNKVVYLNRELNDRSLESIRYGLTDLLLLSRCESILGTYFSSFSEMAERMGNAKIRYSGFDFGQVSSVAAFGDKVSMDEFLYYNAMLIEKLRGQRWLEPLESGPIQLGSEEQLGHGVKGYLGYKLRQLSNFLVKRNILFFTRWIKSFGNFLMRLGKDLTDIDRF